MDDLDNIPQFHKNKNFRIFLYGVFIVVTLFLIIFVVYSSYVSDISYKAKKQFIEKGLQVYYEEHGEYPETLEELLSAGYISPIPKKEGDIPFTYIPLTSDEGIFDKEEGAPYINYYLE